MRERPAALSIAGILVFAAGTAAGAEARHPQSGTIPPPGGAPASYVLTHSGWFHPSCVVTTGGSSGRGAVPAMGGVGGEGGSASMAGASGSAGRPGGAGGASGLGGSSGGMDSGDTSGGGASSGCSCDSGGNPTPGFTLVFAFVAAALWARGRRRS